MVNSYAIRYQPDTLQLNAVDSLRHELHPSIEAMRKGQASPDMMGLMGSTSGALEGALADERAATWDPLFFGAGGRAAPPTAIPSTSGANAALAAGGGGPGPPLHCGAGSSAHMSGHSAPVAKGGASRSGLREWLSAMPAWTDTQRRGGASLHTSVRNTPTRSHEPASGRSRPLERVRRWSNNNTSSLGPPAVWPVAPEGWGQSSPWRASWSHLPYVTGSGALSDELAGASSGGQTIMAQRCPPAPAYIEDIGAAQALAFKRFQDSQRQASVERQRQWTSPPPSHHSAPPFRPAYPPASSYPQQPAAWLGSSDAAADDGHPPEAMAAAHAAAEKALTESLKARGWVTGDPEKDVGHPPQELPPEAYLAAQEAAHRALCGFYAKAPHAATSKAAQSFLDRPPMPGASSLLWGHSHPGPRQTLPSATSNSFSHTDASDRSSANHYSLSTLFPDHPQWLHHPNLAPSRPDNCPRTACPQASNAPGPTAVHPPQSRSQDPVSNAHPLRDGCAPAAVHPAQLRSQDLTNNVHLPLDGCADIDPGTAQAFLNMGLKLNSADIPAMAPAPAWAHIRKLQPPSQPGSPAAAKLLKPPPPSAAAIGTFAPPPLPNFAAPLHVCSREASPMSHGPLPVPDACIRPDGKLVSPFQLNPTLPILPHAVAAAPPPPYASRHPNNQHTVSAISPFAAAARTPAEAWPNPAQPSSMTPKAASQVRSAFAMMSETAFPEEMGAPPPLPLLPTPLPQGPQAPNASSPLLRFTTWPNLPPVLDGCCPMTDDLEAPPAYAGPTRGKDALGEAPPPGQPLFARAPVVPPSPLYSRPAPLASASPFAQSGAQAAAPTTYTRGNFTGPQVVSPLAGHAFQPWKPPSSAESKPKPKPSPPHDQSSSADMQQDTSKTPGSLDMDATLTPRPTPRGSLKHPLTNAPDSGQFPKRRNSMTQPDAPRAEPLARCNSVGAPPPPPPPGGAAAAATAADALLIRTRSRLATCLSSRPSAELKVMPSLPEGRAMRGGGGGGRGGGRTNSSATSNSILARLSSVNATSSAFLSALSLPSPSTLQAAAALEVPAGGKGTAGGATLPLVWVPERLPKWLDAGELQRKVEAQLVRAGQPPKRDDPPQRIDRRSTRIMNDKLGLLAEQRRLLQAERNRQTARLAVERRRQEVKQLETKAVEAVKLRDAIIVFSHLPELANPAISAARWSFNPERDPPPPRAPLRRSRSLSALQDSSTRPRARSLSRLDGGAPGKPPVDTYTLPQRANCVVPAMTRRIFELNPLLSDAAAGWQVGVEERLAALNLQD